tara:strand:- start:22 stop:810 length:789 start_codon:yes stop_codon:yes gene_type:complete
MKKHFILDWDGTATESYNRAETTSELMIDSFSREYGIPKEKLAEAHQEQKRNIRDNERKYPWVHKGHIAAYCEDPIIYSNSAFVEALRSFEPKDVSSLWQEVLLAYSEAYKSTSPVYVDRLPEVLDYLKEQGDIIVVTNSNPRKVKEEVDELSFEIGVIGHAKKYKITPEFANVSDTLRTEDGREVRLRRGAYFSILEKFHPESSFVIGDGFSCDLALPMTLGFNVVLVNDFWSMDWARSEVGKYSEGTTVSSLSGILEKSI